MSPGLLGLLLALLAGTAHAQSNVQDELNRGKAAFHGRRFEEARTRFERLAQAGNADGQFYLGQMAAVGAGTAKDPAQAARWYEQAARQGHVEGQAALGSSYLRGLGVSRSLAEAARWSRLAAGRGHGGAA